MTTYTITEAQRQQFLCAVMSKTDDQCAYAADDLQSLQPNTQEAVGWLIDGLDVVMSHTHAQAEQAEHHAMGGNAVAYPIYTHPSPQQPAKTNWSELVQWWESGGEQWDVLQNIVTRMVNTAAPQQVAELLATDDFYSWWEENPSLGQQQALVQFYDKQPATQQKPLTDGEIEFLWDMWITTKSGPVTKTKALVFARAIEAALGVQP